MSGARETKEQREKRLAEALRANLHRRKDQARERKSSLKPEGENGESPSS